MRHGFSLSPVCKYVKASLLPRQCTRWFVTLSALRARLTIIASTKSSSISSIAFKLVTSHFGNLLRKRKEEGAALAEFRLKQSQEETPEKLVAFFICQPSIAEGSQRPHGTSLLEAETVKRPFSVLLSALKRLGKDIRSFLFRSNLNADHKGVFCNRRLTCYGSKDIAVIMVWILRKQVKRCYDNECVLLIARNRMLTNTKPEFISDLPNTAESVPVISATGYVTRGSAIQSVYLPPGSSLIRLFDLTNFIPCIYLEFEHHLSPLFCS